MSIDIGLDEKHAEKEPYSMFNKWYREAVMNNVAEPNAMLISTVGKSGRPSSRVVYLRDNSEEGFVFFTNYKSRKGIEIAGNEFACANFFWPQLGRQIRIEGKVKWVNTFDSDSYFSLRPRLSRIGAWASPQSQPLLSRQDLEQRVEKIATQFEGKEVPRPEWWGGLRLVPDYFEFWHGRDSRLHDRLTYTLGTNMRWRLQRIAP